MSPFQLSFLLPACSCLQKEDGNPRSCSLEPHRAQNTLFAEHIVVAVALGDTQPCHVCCLGTKQGGGGGKEEKKGNKSITLQQGEY